MKLSRSISVCFLALFLLGAFTALDFPITKALPTFSVIEDENYITVENDYYKAKVEKTRGRLYNFYIKPHDTIDIVTSWSGHALGAHEYESYNGSEGAGAAQWSSTVGYFTLYETTLVYYSSDVAVVYTKFKLNDTDSGFPSGVNITEWKAFYADKPFMVGAFNREHIYEANFLYEQQVCWLFDPAWVEGVRNTDLNGDITGYKTTRQAYTFMAKGMEKFPWWYVYNSTYNTGFGTILLNSYPRDARIGHWFESSLGYAEYQITVDYYASGMPAEVDNVVTYINYVASNETELDNFSRRLYKAMHTTVDTTYYPTSNNYLHTSYGGFYKSGVLGFRFSDNLIRLQNGIYGDASKNRYKPMFSNSSGTYNLWGLLSDASITEWQWKTTYSKMTYRRDFESKLRWETTMEAWSDGDIIKVIHNFTTLATMNITDLYLQIRELYPYENSDIAQLSTDIIKINASTAFTGWIEDNGFAVRNMSGTTEISGVYIYFYALDRDSDHEFPPGLSWSITLHFQGYCMLDKDFEASDFLGLHQEAKKNQIRFDNWIPLPFPEVPSNNGPFRINYLGHENSIVVKSMFNNEKLELTLVGASSTSTDLSIYVGSKGEPASVEGASSWSYDTFTRTLQLTAIHTGTTTIAISWFAVPITATIDIDPKTLNLKSGGKWIRADIELPEGYDARDIDISTVKLNGEIQAELRQAKIKDYDTDRISDLTVEFDRQDVITLLSAGEATLTITGKVNETPFEGTDTIRIIGKRTG